MNCRQNLQFLTVHTVTTEPQMIHIGCILFHENWKKEIPCHIGYILFLANLFVTPSITQEATTCFARKP